ncbi:MAG TPA: outer membrane beta-barrel protein [Puia sp.]|jgi:hypothetical protein|nr:outer membrane beta-barrel protein [Puia sp.]
MRYFLLPIFICLIASEGRAQWDIGLEGGAALNTLQTNIANRPQQQLRPGFGLCIQVPLSYTIPFAKDKGAGANFGLSLQTGFMFLQKGYMLDRTDTLQSLNQQNRNSYVQMPLYALFVFNRKSFSFQLGGGIYIGYWVGGHVKGGMPNIFNTALPYPGTYSYSEPYVFDDRRDDRWEDGWALKTRFVAKLQRSTAVFLAAQFFQSITDQQKVYMQQQIPRYNGTWTASVGIQKELPW